MKRGGFIDDTFLHNSCQSMCYDSRNKRYIVGFAEPGNVSALIRMKDLSFRKDAIDLVVRGLSLDHCNDIAYSPEDHKIYCVGGNWWVAVVNPDTFQVERKIPISMVAWSLARYPNGDWFVHNSEHGERYSHDFSRCTIASIHDQETIVKALNVPYRPDRGDYAGCMQGAICMDGKPYMMYNEFSNETGKPISFVLMSCEMGNERIIYRAGTDREIESADLVGGKMMLAYNSLYRYGGSEWDMNEVYMRTVYAEIGPVDIPNGKEIKIDFSSHVPDGFQLVSANVNLVKADKSIRTLPFIYGSEYMLRVWKIAKNQIYLRAGTSGFDGAKLQITGFCRKK